METERLNRVRAAIALNRVPGVGPVNYRRLVDAFGGAAAVFARAPRELETVEGVGRERAAAIAAFAGWDAVDDELAKADASGLAVCILGDDDYPPPLTEIADPPPVLYYRGSLAAIPVPAIAVVGTRNPTEYGRDATAFLVTPLVEAGVAIVSGMARGIDGHAHRVALDAGGFTVAVLGCGADVLYPPEHKELRDAIASRGVLLSELPPGAPPDPVNFPRRNRIISGLAAGVVVVEAGEKSGALITAYAAAEQGRDVFAVPGNIFSRASDGCRRLLAAGAKPVGSALEILEEIAALSNAGGTPPPDLFSSLESMGEDEKAVWATLTGIPTHADEITARLRWEPARAATALLSLEIANLIQKLPSNYYQKIYG